MAGTCPYCRAPFAADEEVVACPGCETLHHADCLAENGGCTVFGCANAPGDESKVSVSSQDLNASARACVPQTASPHSILNLQPASGFEIPMPPQVTPPPPLSPGVMPPPPPMWQGGYAGGYPNQAGYPNQYSNQYPGPPGPPGYPTFGGYAPTPINPYMPRKSRVVFVLLAVFLGPFGGHNFYAGYITKAVIQLCLSVLTCFAGSIVSWIWAIVEACIIDHDNDGVAFV